MDLDAPIDAHKCYQALLSLFNGNNPSLEMNIVLSFLNDLKNKEVNEILQALQVFLPSALNAFSLKFKELFQQTSENVSFFVVIDNLKLFTAYLYGASLSKSLPSSSKKSLGSRSVISTRSESAAFFKAKSKRENKEKKIQKDIFKQMVAILGILQERPLYNEKIDFEDGGKHAKNLQILKRCQNMVMSFPEGTKNTKPFKSVIPSPIKSCFFRQYFKRIATIKDNIEKKAKLKEAMTQACEELKQEEELLENEDDGEDIQDSEGEDSFPDAGLSDNEGDVLD